MKTIRTLFALSLALFLFLFSITDKNVLVAGHSDNVPGIILELTGENIGAITDYDNLFVIKRKQVQQS